MASNLATLYKDGQLINVPESELRCGDVVVLQAGEVVPADLRLMDAWELEI